MLQELGFDVDMVQVDTPTFLQLIKKEPADGSTLSISTSSRLPGRRRPLFIIPLRQQLALTQRTSSVSPLAKSLGLDRQGHPHCAALPNGGDLRRSKALEFQADAQRKLLYQSHELG